MSATLNWRPRNNGKTLPYELRQALEKRFDISSPHGQHVFSSDDLVEMAYIDALVNQEVPGAAALKAAIEKHEQIEVWVSY